MAPGGHWLSVESTPSSSSYQGTLIKAALSRFLSRDFPLLLVFIFFSIIWRRRRKRTQRRPTRTKGRRRSRKVCLGALAPSRLLFDNGNHNESKKLKERRGNGEKVLLDFLSGKSCLSVLSCFFLIVCVCVCVARAFFIMKSGPTELCVCGFVVLSSFLIGVRYPSSTLLFIFSLPTSLFHLLLDKGVVGSNDDLFFCHGNPIKKFDPSLCLSVLFR